MSQGVGASTPEQESEAVKQLKAQNQALTDAMQQLRETAQASEERAAAAEIRAAALEELVKEAERRAKASGRPVKTLFCIIKSRACGMCCESDPFALAQRPVWR
jgi:outer membrane murein-binding lipoprotein Lpp